MIETAREKKIVITRITDVDLIQPVIEKTSVRNCRVSKLSKPDSLKALALVSNNKYALNTYQRQIKANGNIQDVSKSDVLSAVRRFKRASSRMTCNCF